jgi:hypothetical protein
VELINVISYYDSNIEITAVRARVGRDIQSAQAASGSSSLASLMTFDADSVADTLPDQVFDPVSMDESWFVSQDFYFDDIV